MYIYRTYFTKSKFIEAMKKRLLFAYFFLFSFCTLPLISQPGSLDLSFGENGIVVAPQTPDEEQTYKIAVQQDGKIVVGGFVNAAAGQDFLVTRYLTNGELDPDFGLNGVATFDGGTIADVAWDMAIQADGKILLGGNVNNVNTTVDDYALVRLNPDGSPDNSFGTGGLVVTDIEQKWDNVYAMALQDDGRILLAGESYSYNFRRVCVCRYLPDGSLDNDFCCGGFAPFKVGMENDHPRDMAIQEDGMYIIAGYFDDLSDQAFISRLDQDGNLDNNFGSNGTATLDIGGKDDRFNAVLIQPDGKILVGGMNGEPGNWDYLFARYNSDGTMDLSFGSNGIILIDFSINDIALEMALQEDNKILCTGGGYQFELLRLNENGYPDLDFGNDGLVNTSFGNEYAFSKSLVLQADGRILVGGNVINNSEYDLAICRYHAEDNGLVPAYEPPVKSFNINPNPASENISLHFELEKRLNIAIELVDHKGQMIKNLMSEKAMPAGTHQVFFRLPANMASGMYFVRIKTTAGNVSQKLILQ
jgi:uncharacterized delta-60 repeat protein